MTLVVEAKVRLLIREEALTTGRSREDMAEELMPFRFSKCREFPGYKTCGVDVLLTTALRLAPRRKDQR